MVAETTKPAKPGGLRVVRFFHGVSRAHPRFAGRHLGSVQVGPASQADLDAALGYQARSILSIFRDVAAQELASLRQPTKRLTTSRIALRTLVF